jgi:hypothetical protein
VTSESKEQKTERICERRAETVLCFEERVNYLFLEQKKHKRKQGIANTNVVNEL